MKFALSVLGLISLLACGDPLATELVPGPNLTPEEVVRIQLEALRNNDAEDRGIAVAFRFASPANRRVTGPLPRFARMIKEEPYNLMLNYEEARFGPVEEESEDAARQRVVLLDQGAVRQYIFQLSRRRFEPCEGCWMTDSVEVEQDTMQRVAL